MLKGIGRHGGLGVWEEGDGLQWRYWTEPLPVDRKRPGGMIHRPDGPWPHRQSKRLSHRLDGLRWRIRPPMGAVDLDVWAPRDRMPEVMRQLFSCTRFGGMAGTRTRLLVAVWKSGTTGVACLRGTASVSVRDCLSAGRDRRERPARRKV
jgi:hypothetical protein